MPIISLVLIRFIRMLATKYGQSECKQISTAESGHIGLNGKKCILECLHVFSEYRKYT